MQYSEFRAFLALMMCSDPWPVDDPENQKTLEGLANKEARDWGWKDWIDAYHNEGGVWPRPNYSAEEPNKQTGLLEGGDHE